MTEQENIKDIITKENKNINNLNKINNILLEQLTIVQKELEKSENYIKNLKTSKTCISTATSIYLYPKEVNNALIENLKLKALVEQQKLALHIERTNSLSVRLGEMLINGVKSINSFILLPFKLLKTWRALENPVPPATLGGKDFHKVIEAYWAGGSNDVEKLLSSTFISSVMRANAYTAIAKNLIHTDSKRAAEYARLAWENDPKPYRLKWLAFRIHETNNPIIAEALLDILPNNINMTDSEKNHSICIRNESKKLRENYIKNKLKPYEIEAKNLENEINNLRQSYKYIKNKYDDNIKIVNKIEEYKQKIDQTNKQNIILQKKIEQSCHEIAIACKEKQSLQNMIDIQKKEYDILTLKTALIIKNILINFEHDSKVLSQVMHIIMSINSNK